MPPQVLHWMSKPRGRQAQELPPASRPLFPSMAQGAARGEARVAIHPCAKEAGTQPPVWGGGQVAPSGLNRKGRLARRWEKLPCTDGGEPSGARPHFPLPSPHLRTYLLVGPLLLVATGTSQRETARTPTRPAAGQSPRKRPEKEKQQERREEGGVPPRPHSAHSGVSESAPGTSAEILARGDFHTGVSCLLGLQASAREPVTGGLRALTSRFTVTA